MLFLLFRRGAAMKFYQRGPLIVRRKPLTPPTSTPLAKASTFASYAAICVGLCAFLSDVRRKIRGF
uniref:Uncharacterized protein n=1 Tax=Hyaloperonospora arabidopsidis (strain Emoy2) TaxID=559515 RepID=M4BTU3_HYAAE